MTIQTVITWNPFVSPEIKATIDAAAAQAALEGKTDDMPERSPAPPPSTTVRTWTTLADAEAWLAFVQSYNPVSAVIVQSEPPSNQPV